MKTNRLLEQHFGSSNTLDRLSSESTDGDSDCPSHVSDSDEDHQSENRHSSPQESREYAPPWVWTFIFSHVYHKFCKRHSIKSSPQPFLTKLKYYEPATERVLCQVCVRSREHPHVIQVYKVVGRSAVRANDVAPFLDVKEISGMPYNNCLHVFINKKLEPALQKELSVEEKVCLHCKQTLSYDSEECKYCSIFCKFDFKRCEQAQNARDGHFDNRGTGAGNRQQVVARPRSTSWGKADGRTADKDLSDEVTTKEEIGHVHGKEENSKGSSDTADQNEGQSKDKCNHNDCSGWNDGLVQDLGDCEGVQYSFRKRGKKSLYPKRSPLF